MFCVASFWLRQDPLRQVYDYMVTRRIPLPSSPRFFPKYHYGRHSPSTPSDAPSSTTIVVNRFRDVYHYAGDLGPVKYLRVYRYLHFRRENDYFHYGS